MILVETWAPLVYDHCSPHYILVSCGLLGYHLSAALPLTFIMLVFHDFNSEFESKKLKIIKTNNVTVVLKNSIRLYRHEMMLVI